MSPGGVLLFLPSLATNFWSQTFLLFLKSLRVTIEVCFTLSKRQTGLLKTTESFGIFLRIFLENKRIFCPSVRGFRSEMPLGKIKSRMSQIILSDFCLQFSKKCSIFRLTVSRLMSMDFFISRSSYTILYMNISNYRCLY